ncbi:hypothetical protein LB543_31195 [Mesorhizobium sp. ESP7-2]|uniref:hypothetical protein n=1 Tax=Mesorhizobium sp. ESP7-2 TaxID=2876622 RepID=UPI001CD00B18|nr:hypothetical protein [Mesorhizobium sp. ESP7-2]MBZ9711165.1 hypothetical protein [Mesorhizobium sp. ESP7-2]
MDKVDLKASWRNRPIAPSDLTAHLPSRPVDTRLLRTDAFDSFKANRRGRLLALIGQAAGKDFDRGNVVEEGVNADQDEDEIEAELTVPAAE